MAEETIVTPEGNTPAPEDNTPKLSAAEQQAMEQGRSTNFVLLAFQA